MELFKDPGLRMVVTDIDLPVRQNGIDIAIAARRLYPGISVIFISAASERLPYAQKIGSPVAFLPKPFRLATLMEAMNYLMAANGSGNNGDSTRGFRPMACFPPSYPTFDPTFDCRTA